MDFSRIANLIDVERMQRSSATIVGSGGFANLARNLVRCGLQHVRLVDFDTIEHVNICRQEHSHDTVGRRKVDALADELRRINPAVNVECYPKDFTTFSEAEIDRQFGDSDVLLIGVDNLAANARANEVALRLGIPAVWSGVYAGGRAGEIVLWHPGLKACYRCLCQARYRAWEQGRGRANPAQSADVLSVQLIDSITGMVAIGFLTRGADNMYGRLIDQLGDRNFLQVKVDPAWNWNGRDIIREQLQVPEKNDAFFSFCTIARRDPTDGEPPCPDCVRYRGRQPASTLESIPESAWH